MAAAAGESHSAAVGEDGSLFVWGSGNYGQLGTGDTASRLAPTRVAGLPAPAPLFVSFVLCVLIAIVVCVAIFGGSSSAGV